MAQFHLSVKAIGRSGGRSATAAAAYRSAEKIVDRRTGEIHDYTHKAGVVGTALMLPGGASADRSEFWNAVEQHHKRGDAVLAREFTLALPHELLEKDLAQLAFDYGRELADRYGVAVDVCIHRPDKQGDNRNHHAHVMMSACHVSPDGELGKKAVELDPIHCGRAKIENFAERERRRWAELHNERMAELGHDGRIDHRSLEAQGLDREPTQHLGVAATGYERRTGERSVLRLRLEAEATERRQRATELGGQRRAELAMNERGLVVASTELASALAKRDRLAQVRDSIAVSRAGWASLREEVGKDRQRQKLEREAMEQERARQAELARIEKQYPKLAEQLREKGRDLQPELRRGLENQAIQKVREHEKKLELQRSRRRDHGLSR